MQISAKADYAVRIAAELAASTATTTTAKRIAERQGIPFHYVVKILPELRNAGLIQRRQGYEGGHCLALPADDISIADVLRVVEGPLVLVRGERPERVQYNGSAVPLQHVWLALRTNARVVLETVTLAHLTNHRLPNEIESLAITPESCVTRR